MMVLGIFGLTARVARLVPAPIVFGVLAGSILPFVVGIFDALADERLLVGGALLTYLFARRFLSARVPAVLPALLVGLVLAGASGRFRGLPIGGVLPALDPERPTFSPTAIVTVVPIFVALIALGGNLPAVVYLRSQGYRPPARLIDAVTGLAAMLGSFLGRQRSIWQPSYRRCWPASTRGSTASVTGRSTGPVSGGCWSRSGQASPPASRRPFPCRCCLRSPA